MRGRNSVRQPHIRLHVIQVETEPRVTAGPLYHGIRQGLAYPEIGVQSGKLARGARVICSAQFQAIILYAHRNAVNVVILFLDGRRIIGIEGKLRRADEPVDHSRHRLTIRCGDIPKHRAGLQSRVGCLRDCGIRHSPLRGRIVRILVGRIPAIQRGIISIEPAVTGNRVYPAVLAYRRGRIVDGSGRKRGDYLGSTILVQHAVGVMRERVQHIDNAGAR